MLVKEAIMIIFNTDLDNTIIYSYKHDIGKDKLCVEIYQGREVSYITSKTAQLLKKVNEAVVMVPTTTRTREQYDRIDLGIGTPKYALVCNGGVLIVDGEEDEEWFAESREMIADCQSELVTAQSLLENDPNRTLDVRYIRELFVFTKSSEPQKTVEMLQRELDGEKIDVFRNGVKVYAVPKLLNKGEAVRRLRERLCAGSVIAAGDSEFDVSMLNAADTAFVPKDFPLPDQLTSPNIVVSEDGMFSEYILQSILSSAS